MQEATEATSDGQLRLSDGRLLGYGVVGRPTGRAVLYLHGAIGSPLSPSPELCGLVDELGVQFVTVYRPGFGGSDPHPGRSILDHAEDVRQLADALGIERFGVVGVSAGGPYAMACAHELPDRVIAAAAISSMSPLGAPSASRAIPRRVRVPLMALAHAPRTCTSIGDLGVRLIRHRPRLLLRSMAAGAPASDRDLLAEARTGSEAIDSFMVATARGVSGMIEDYLVTIAPWGFEPAAIQTEVHLWHGMQDIVVPVDHALQLSTSSPRFQITLDPDEGHFFFRRRLPEILRGLFNENSAAAAPQMRVLRQKAAPEKVGSAFQVAPV